MPNSKGEITNQEQKANRLKESQCECCIHWKRPEARRDCPCKLELRPVFRFPTREEPLRYGYKLLCPHFCNAGDMIAHLLRENSRLKKAVEDFNVPTPR